MFFFFQIIAKKNGVKWEGVKKLIDVQKRLDKTLNEMADIANVELDKDSYTLEEVMYAYKKKEKV